MNVIIGQAHFIKTVEDLHEALAGVSPHLRFDLAFCEASSARLVRRSGNDDDLTGQAAANALAIGADRHSLLRVLRTGGRARLWLTAGSRPQWARVQGGSSGLVALRRCREAAGISGWAVLDEGRARRGIDVELEDIRAVVVANRVHMAAPG